MPILIGFLIAVAIGLTGVGGGVITAPALILLVGLPAPVAVGTALAFVVLVKSLAVPMYLWRGQVNWRVLGRMAAGGVPGAVAGSFVLRRASVMNLENVVLAAVGLVVLASSAFTLARMYRGSEPRAPRERPRALTAVAAVIGMEVGFSSAGAGALGTVVLFQFSRLSPAEVVGTDLVFGFLVSLAGGAAHFAAGSVDAALAAQLAAGGVFGVVLGARLAAVLPGRVVRAAISLVLAGVGLRLCFNGFAMIAGFR